MTMINENMMALDVAATNAANAAAKISASINAEFAKAGPADGYTINTDVDGIYSVTIKPADEGGPAFPQFIAAKRHGQTFTEYGAACRHSYTMHDDCVRVSRMYAGD